MNGKIKGCIVAIVLALGTANASTPKADVEEVIPIPPAVKGFAPNVLQAVEPTPKPTIVVEEEPVIITEPVNPLEGFTRADSVLVTHYCICQKCCGKTPDNPAYGVTASGRTAEPGLSIAVDTSAIPLGSTVFVDYGDGVIHQYRADDTGGAIKGNRIDVCVASHEEALNAGVKTATIWWKEN